MQSTIVLLVALLWFEIPMAGSLVTLYTGLTLLHHRQRRLGAIDLGGFGKHAASHALHLHADHAVDSAVGAWRRRCATCRTSSRSPHSSIRLRFAIDLVQRVYLEGVGLLMVVHDLIPLLIISAITLPLAAWLFRNRLL